MTSYNKKKVSGILYLIIAYFVTILIIGNSLAFSFAPMVTQFLGQKDYKIQESDGDTDTEYYKSDYTNLDKLIEDETSYAKQVQAEGTLLKNANLPLSGNEEVALLGIDSKNGVFRAGGGGSGAVDTSRAPKIADSFKQAGYKVNSAVLNFYDSLNDSTPEPHASQLPTFSSDVGIIFIGRAGSEGGDLTAEGLELTDNEKSLIDLSLSSCKKTVVLLNVVNPVECGYLKDKNVSILWIGAPGEIAIGCIPEVLNGKINPSGRLVDIYPYDITSAPTMRNYGNLSLTNVSESTGNKYVNYAESIYYGYRYYETRYADKVTKRSGTGNYNYSEQVIYPFGYGTSYTEFEYSDFKVSEQSNIFRISVTVTNKGNVAGKEVVQVYMQKPYTSYDIQNQVEKSAIELAGFAKTNTLSAGSSETVTIEVKKSELKTYDYTNAKTYIFEEGDYYFTAAKNSHDAINNVLALQDYTVSDGMTENGNKNLAAVYHKDSTDNEVFSVSSETGNKITNIYADADLRYYMPETVYLTRNNWEGTYPEQATDMEATEQWVEDIFYDIVNIEDMTEDPNAVMPKTNQKNGLTLASLIGTDYDNEYWDLLLDEMSPEEMMTLNSVGGYGTQYVESIAKPGTIDQDGPASLDGSVMGGSVRPFAHPTEILIASTWNLELAEKYGYFIGEDGLMTGIVGWYAPAMNIHRTPCAGRNFEYYSEDPIHSGMFAATTVKAAQAKGMIVYIKHFALNDQETNRSSVCTFATEQAIREIYLKPFEIAIKDGGALGIMNSMNRIGAVWAGAHKALLTTTLRDEWGFKGIVITDATLNQSNKMRPLPALLAGNDLWLCTNVGIFEITGYQNSPTVMTALRESCHRILYAFSNSAAMNGFASDTKVIGIMPPWQIFLIATDCVLFAVAAAGIVIITIKLVKTIKEEKKNEN